MLGRIYLAHEGINAQISLPTEKMDAFKEYLYSIEALNKLRLNIAVDDSASPATGVGKSFYVLDIKVRNKIVADGLRDEHGSRGGLVGRKTQSGDEVGSI